jgi:hypothetical protein
MATEHVPVVSYVSRDLLSRVQQEAKRSNRSVAGQVREILQRALEAQPKIEKR